MSWRPPRQLRHTVVYRRIVAPVGGGVNTLSEQTRSTKARGYRKVKRADEEQRTRARIVDAAEALHGRSGRRTPPSPRSPSGRGSPGRRSTGTSRTTSRCSSPAPASGCRGRPCPTPTPGARSPTRSSGSASASPTSTATSAPASRCSRTSSGTRPSYPTGCGAPGWPGERLWRETLLRGLPGERRATVRAAVAHATAFGTWRSLCLDQGLSDRAAVELMVAMVLAAGDRMPRRGCLTRMPAVDASHHGLLIPGRGDPP